MARATDGTDCMGRQPFAGPRGLKYASGPCSADAATIAKTSLARGDGTLVWGPWGMVADNATDDRACSTKGTSAGGRVDLRPISTEEDSCCCQLLATVAAPDGARVRADANYHGPAMYHGARLDAPDAITACGCERYRDAAASSRCCSTAHLAPPLLSSSELLMAVGPTGGRPPLGATPILTSRTATARA